ncbi:GntR family transcriptional regulator [Flexivirga oryzae]|uniref:DNA-binding GntR family transcriptional regulator n=1 Tax=Flexivirga oryzae TaxID=1794944 RepID=A0A839N8M2_9MICO|nr:GntR family transcriptional regulator [Flexivirga oryzae]MBB2891101.1 DNA-binding GntR family transcriptional regulator [Flexivirga oryzae]
MTTDESAWISKLHRADGYATGPYVLSELRRVIVSGQVKPGASLPLDAIGDFFQVSRIPVREALKTLIGEGLVRHQPRGGYTVTVLSGPELHELYLVRGALEAAAIEAATAAAGPDDDRRAGEVHAELLEAIAVDDVPRYQNLSRAFHETLLAPCAMPRLLHMLSLVADLTEPSQAMSLLDAPQRAELQTDHTRMLEAFLARDGAGLSAAARAHHGRLTAYIDESRNGHGDISAD